LTEGEEMMLLSSSTIVDKLYFSSLLNVFWKDASTGLLLSYTGTGLNENELELFKFGFNSLLSFLLELWEFKTGIGEIL
jgi:hypothetical protein